MKGNGGKYDIVVGIPSYNEADNIASVAEAAGEGLEKYFPGQRGIIVNVDNSSPDGTKAAFLSARTHAEKEYVSTESGVLGKGNNLLNLFNFARQSEARIIMVVDADLKSISSEWIENLGRPVAEGYDYVAPLYSRHQFDATITNHICYPALFGMFFTDMRQPIGGDFAFSPRLMNYWLKQPWTESVRHYGIDIFMTLHAILGGFRVCQSFLGTKMHKPSAPKIGSIFEQVVETLLDMLVNNRDAWMRRGSGALFVPDTFGGDLLPEPREVALDIHAMKEACHREYNNYLSVIGEYLDPYALSRVKEMFEADIFDMNTLLWAQIFYTMVYRYDTSKSEEERKMVINILKPLYMARSLSFNYHTWRDNIKYAEIEIRKQALGFAAQKHYLWGLYDEGAH